MKENNNSRRNFLKLLGISPAIALSPALAATTSNPHIVVVGGGFSGATCAKYLKLWGGDSITVTIIEPNSTYISPILSNLVLNGQKTTADLSFNYASHNSKYKINITHAQVMSVNKSNKTLTLSNNTEVSYDKLVLAPGIDFIQSNPYDFSKIPHAWIAGAQTNLLKTQIDSMQNGDTFLMTIPAAPFRCPPGPYERACVVADYLKRKGLTNSQVVVLDANNDIIVEKDTFGAKFIEYGIDYRTNISVTNVDDTTKTLTFSENGTIDTMSVKVLNVIPNQKAGKIIFDAGLNNGNWAPVNPLSYESTLMNDIFIIGDSQATTQPKAGHIGNSEAKVCADAILRKLNNIALYTSPKTNSACYSPVSSSDASWLSAVYKYDNTTQQMVLAHKAAGAPSRKNYQDMFNWSGNLFSDTFK